MLFGASWDNTCELFSTVVNNKCSRINGRCDDIGDFDDNGYLEKSYT